MKPFCRNRPFPRVGRTLPPAAAPFSLGEIFQGLRGCIRPKREMARFEAELRDFFQVRYCFPVSSGKTALYLLLRALHQLRPGCDEILIPAYTCFSVPSAIIRAGLKITLCDIDPGTLDFDFSCLEALLDEKDIAGRLLCVLPTHLFGLPADVKRLQELLRAKCLADVPVIEDAAQAMGATNREGLLLGTRGDAGFFSLGRGKPLSLGGGGIIITDREDLACALAPLVAALGPLSLPDLFRLMAVTAALIFLVRPAWFWLPKAVPWLKLGETLFDPGFANRRLSAFQAGLALHWSTKLKRLQATRAGQATGWSTILPVGLRYYESVNRENLIRFPVRIGSRDLRDRVLAESDRYGLGVMPGYPTAVSGIAALKNRFGGFPAANASSLAEELLTLPMHQFVTARDRQRTAALFAGRKTDLSKAFSLAGPG